MLAALLFGIACVSCDSESDNKPNGAEYELVEIKINLSASDAAREMFTFSGTMIGFSNEEVVTAAEIEAVNYSSPTTLTFNMLEDAPGQATLQITAAKKDSFQPSDKSGDVSFTAEIIATAYDTKGNILATTSDMISKTYKGAEYSDEFRNLFLMSFPANRVISFTKSGDSYELIAAGMAH